MAALTKIREWDYNSDARIALGIFYQQEAATFEKKFAPSRVDAQERDSKISLFLNKNK
jgi:hypothetical protein